MLHDVFAVGPLGCNCQILGDERTRLGLVVDPGGDVSEILARAARLRLTITEIVVTHAHLDHIAGAAELKRLTGATLRYSQFDLPLVALMGWQAAWIGIPPPEPVPEPDSSPRDGETLRLGDEAITFLATPGHSPGSLCLYLPAHHLLLAGDTLFSGSVGRTDLPGGDHGVLMRSLREKVMALSDETLVFPGHGSATSVGAERDTNPFL